MARKATTETTVETFKEGGRGRKQCPSCQKFIGARNSVCACGHKFEVKASSNGKRKASKAPTDPMEVIRKVREFGGVAAVEKKLKELAAMQAKVDEAAKGLAPFNDGFFGPVEGAEAALKLMEEVEGALKGK